MKLLRQATGLESGLVVAYLFDTEAIPHACDNRKSKKKSWFVKGTKGTNSY